MYDVRTAHAPYRQLGLETLDSRLTLVQSHRYSFCGYQHYGYGVAVAPKPAISDSGTSGAGSEEGKKETVFHWQKRHTARRVRQSSAVPAYHIGRYLPRYRHSMLFSLTHSRPAAIVPGGCHCQWHGMAWHASQAFGLLPGSHVTLVYLQKVGGV
ncbi:hypothetical protein LX32DRAFT_639672 [Colletotrichum zoysiae]|uniref:Uncharacterized protein n=1 Tax=Colletotrichum zoysiae TaxID=1216348 RepID=A0AAD9HJ17_9PEZI|nr:hypothetical protein LX32DRAFT_639672 [Colletotrichum zoysiae]